MISVAIPCYCSGKIIERVVADIKREFNNRNKSYQIILVNDGSTDDTFNAIERLCSEDKNIIGVNLSRNFGQHSARMAAIPYIKGDYVIYMDDDGQHPVEGIFPLIEKLNEGYDVVYALFKDKKHSFIKQTLSNMNSATLSWLNGKPRNIKTSSFCVIRIFVLKEMMNYRSPFPSWAGYIMQITRSIANLELPHYQRLEGKSGYTLKKMFLLWISGLTSFSIVPLQFASLLGLIATIFGFILGVVIIVTKIMNPAVPAGYASLMSVIVFIGGIIMFQIGLLGEYIGRTFMTISNMPQYIVREVLNDGNKHKET